MSLNSVFCCFHRNYCTSVPPGCQEMRETGDSYVLSMQVSVVRSEHDILLTSCYIGIVRL